MSYGKLRPSDLLISADVDVAVAQIVLSPARVVATTPHPQLVAPRDRPKLQSLTRSRRWENCWDEVQCCSDRCKNERKRKQQLANREQRAAAVEGLAPDTAAAPAPAVAVQQSPP